MIHTSRSPSRSRAAQRRLVQAGVLACGVAAGLVELFALQRRRLSGRIGRV